MAEGYSVNRPGVKFVKINSNEIEREKEIGSGAFGKVYKGKWRGRPVAVKDIGTDSEAERNAFKNELQQLSRVSHRNIVMFFGACTETSNCCLVTEYAEDGSLYKRLHKNATVAYTTADAINWARQCAEAVDYLHSMKPKPLIHRDLKSLNLLLFNQGQTLKLCDFGTVRDRATIMTRSTGSIPWMAPEMFDTRIEYTEKCDVYSFGILLWEIMFREMPFRNLEVHQIMMEVCSNGRPTIDKRCQNSIKHLITKCWDPSPKKRPAMKQVIKLISKINANEPILKLSEEENEEPLTRQSRFFENIREANRGDAAMGQQCQLNDGAPRKYVMIGMFIGVFTMVLMSILNR